MKRNYGIQWLREHQILPLQNNKSFPRRSTLSTMTGQPSTDLFSPDEVLMGIFSGPYASCGRLNGILRHLVSAVRLGPLG